MLLLLLSVWRTVRPLCLCRIMELADIPLPLSPAGPVTPVADAGQSSSNSSSSSSGGGWAHAYKGADLATPTHMAPELMADGSTVPGTECGECTSLN